MRLRSPIKSRHLAYQNSLLLPSNDRAEPRLPAVRRARLRRASPHARRRILPFTIAARGVAAPARGTVAGPPSGPTPAGLGTSCWWELHIMPCCFVQCSSNGRRRSSAARRAEPPCASPPRDVVELSRKSSSSGAAASPSRSRAHRARRRPRRRRSRTGPRKSPRRRSTRSRPKRGPRGTSRGNSAISLTGWARPRTPRRHRRPTARATTRQTVDLVCCKLITLSRASRLAPVLDKLRADEDPK